MANPIDIAHYKRTGRQREIDIDAETACNYEITDALGGLYEGGTRRDFRLHAQRIFMAFGPGALGVFKDHIVNDFYDGRIDSAFATKIMKAYGQEYEWLQQRKSA